MAAAKPVPQGTGWTQEFQAASVTETSTAEDGTPQARLYCGRSINLLTGQLSSLESPAEKRGGMTGFRQSNDPDRVVSF